MKTILLHIQDDYADAITITCVGTNSGRLKVLVEGMDISKEQNKKERWIGDKEWVKDFT